MKISISLSDEDVAILDDFIRTAGLPSRSSGLQNAVWMLRLRDLERDYETGWQEWESSGDQAAWSVTDADGIVDAAR